MDKTKLYKCSCKSEYQDKNYGKQVRVMNSCKGTNGIPHSMLRCTVCEVKHG